MVATGEAVRRQRPDRSVAYRALLVPLDGTPIAERALPFAVRLATLAGARLLLVRTVREQGGAARAEALAYLAALAAPLRGNGLAVETATPQGVAAEAVAAFAAEAGADLIVMATSGGWLIGRGDDLAPALLSRVAIPILLVRDWHSVGTLVREPGQAMSPLSPIVVALDGSALAERALAPALAFAGLLGSELVLVRAVPAAQPGVPEGWAFTSPGWRAGCAAEAEDYLRGVAEGLATQGVTVRCEVRPGGPAAAIHNAARDHGAALLALATHGQTGLAMLPMGSIARQVLWEAGAPVVLVHPALPRERADLADHLGAAAPLAGMGNTPVEVPVG